MGTYESHNPCPTARESGARISYRLVREEPRSEKRQLQTEKREGSQGVGGWGGVLHACGAISTRNTKPGVGVSLFALIPTPSRPRRLGRGIEAARPTTTNACARVFQLIRLGATSACSMFSSTASARCHSPDIPSALMTALKHTTVGVIPSCCMRTMSASDLCHSFACEARVARGARASVTLSARQAMEPHHRLRRNPCSRRAQQHLQTTAAVGPNACVEQASRRAGERSRGVP